MSKGSSNMSVTSIIIVGIDSSTTSLLFFQYHNRSSTQQPTSKLITAVYNVREQSGCEGKDQGKGGKYHLTNELQCNSWLVFNPYHNQPCKHVIGNGLWNIRGTWWWCREMQGIQLHNGNCNKNGRKENYTKNRM